MQIQMEQEQEMQALQERESQIRQLEVSVMKLIPLLLFMNMDALVNSSAEYV